MEKDYSVDEKDYADESMEDSQKGIHLFGKTFKKDKKEENKIKEVKKDNKSLLQKIGLQNLCILLVLGILCVVLWVNDGSSKSTSNTKKATTESASSSLDANPIYTDTETESDEYVAKLEEKLKTVLKKIDSIGDVEVMITLSESKELVTLKDAPYTQDTISEDDGEGGSRVSDSVTQEDETVMSTTKDGESTPYIVKEIQPTIEGVLIVAQGASDPELELDIVEAVEALFDLPVNKIKVIEMKAGK